MSELKDLITDQIPRLRRYARALAGNRARADDLVQDTLERAWTRRHLWRPESNLRAWLFTIMHNLYVNQSRRSSRHPEVALEYDLPSGAAGGEQSLALRDLARSLERLSVEQREVVLLVGLEQLRYSEVAEVLGVPLGTVMSRLARAREQLRTLMSVEATPQLRRVK